MNKKVIILSILLICTISFPALSSWSTSFSEDVMTGEKIWYAISSNVEPTQEMDFPYSDTEAWIGIGYDGKKEWVYIGFTESPNILNSDIEEGYNSINTRVKWNDKLEYTDLTQTWGSKYLNFSNDEVVISKIDESNTLLVELDWYGEGKVYFKFPLEGSSSAIKKIRSEF